MDLPSYPPSDDKTGRTAMPTVDAQVDLGIWNLRKTFGNLEAVRDLSLSIFRGEIFGFLGPNGAGKTTTIRMIAGLLKADSGRIEIQGHQLAGKLGKVRRLMGLCPQELVIWETLTCMEQLTFLGTQYDLSRRKATHRAEELLDILGLLEKQDKLAKALSGGMKRRLNLALALIHDPEILILDEPQAGLDPQSRILVRDFLRSLAREKTVILTTHEMDEADRLSDRVGIIDHGHLLVLDTPEALKETHAGGEVLELAFGPDTTDHESFLQRLPQELTALESLPGTLRIGGPQLHDHVPQILRLVGECNLEATDIRLRKPTLEDVFISLTGRGLRE